MSDLSLKQQIDAKRAAAKLARERRDAAEFESSVGPLLLEHDEYEVVHVPDAPADLPGYVVLRPPKRAELAKLRHTVMQDSKKNGAIEAKSKMLTDLAEQCRVYPSAEKYEELVDRFAAVADECGKKAHAMAEAGADADAKS